MTRDFDDEWLQSGFVKMFMDGVMDSGTAWRLDDYPDQPGHRSVPLFEPERFKALAAEIDRRGLQIAVHAIGDAAVRATIDGYEAARRRERRPRQPPPDRTYRTDRRGPTCRGWARWGSSPRCSRPIRPARWTFGLQPSLDKVVAGRGGPTAFLRGTSGEAGAPLAFASDWPVTDVSVLRNIQAALTREPYEGATDQRVGLMETLAAYTAGGAWAAHREHVTGRLVPGLAGDLVLLGGDIEATPPDAVGAMGIALTVCGGRITHEAGA